MAALRLRAPEPSELPALSDLCLRSKAVWGYDRAFLDACAAELSLTREDLSTSHVTVADRAGVPVGVAQVAVIDGEADLLKLFVEPDRLRLGIGKLLFGWVLDTARQAGARRLTIEADPGAVPFYEAMGGVRAGDAPSGSIPGRSLPRLVLDLSTAA